MALEKFTRKFSRRFAAPRHKYTEGFVLGFPGPFHGTAVSVRFAQQNFPLRGKLEIALPLDFINFRSAKISVAFRATRSFAPPGINYTEGFALGFPGPLCDPAVSVRFRARVLAALRVVEFPLRGKLEITLPRDFLNFASRNFCRASRGAP